jgi:hypothetical protein
MTYQSKLLLAIGTFWLFFAVLCFSAMLITRSFQSKPNFPDIIAEQPTLETHP